MRALLDLEDARELLEKYGFPLLDEGIAKTGGEAVRIADRMGYPVVLKLQPTENPVTDVSTLNSEEEVRQEYREILKNAASRPEGADMPTILVQKHTAPGMEAVVGMTRDPQLGPIVTFSLSGMFAFLKDISHRIAPVSKEEALNMIKETDAYGIVKGDGENASDTDAIADVIERVSKLSVENDNILEIDINPLFVYEKGAVVIDTRITVGYSRPQRNSE